MTAPPRRRLAPVQRREQILAAATRLFREHPYTAVSTTDLAKAAGVARGLINHYFGTKRGLYLEVVRRLVTIPRFAVDQLPAGPLEVRVTSAIDWFLTGVSRHGRAWLSATGGWDPEVDRILTEADEVATDRMLEATGLPTDAVLRAMMRSYGGMVKSACREWLVHENLTRDQVRLLLTTALLALIRDAVPSLGDDRPPLA